MEKVTKLPCWGSFMPMQNSKLHILDFYIESRWITFGRDPRNTFSFTSDAVSETHFMLKWIERDIVRIFDTSLNGTWVNGRRIMKSANYILRDGAEVSFGKGGTEYRFIFRFFSGLLPTTEMDNVYTKIFDIGQGAQGSVFKAVCKSTSKFVAIKAIRGGLGQSFAAVVREMELLKAIQHNNIVKLVDPNMYRDGNYVHVVMEFVDGGDLFSRIAMGKYTTVDEAMVQHLIYQICDAVKYLHMLNIAHRDIKLENILITNDNPPILKIADFGLSNVINSTREVFVSRVGTTQYAAPEMKPGVPYTQLVDSWSVGIVLYALITGTLPFDGNDDNWPYVPRLLQLFNMTYKLLSAEAKDFLKMLLQTDPDLRLPIVAALDHAWLQNYLDDQSKPVWTWDAQGVPQKRRNLRPLGLKNVTVSKPFKLLHAPSPSDEKKIFSPNLLSVAKTGAQLRILFDDAENGIDRYSVIMY